MHFAQSGIDQSFSFSYLHGIMLPKQEEKTCVRYQRTDFVPRSRAQYFCWTRSLLPLARETA